MIRYPKGNFNEIGVRIRDGDEAAFQTFFEAMYPGVFERAFHYLKNYEDARDSTQEVFIKLWQKRFKYNVCDAGFLAWFQVLAERTLIDVYRRNKRTLTSVETSMDAIVDVDEKFPITLSEIIADPCESALDGLIKEEFIMEIENILLRLKITPLSRLTFILYYFEGYKHSQISQIVGGSVGGSKMRVYKVSTKVRKHFENLNINKEGE